MGRHNTWLWRLTGVGRLLHQPSANTVLAKEAVQKKKQKEESFFKEAMRKLRERGVTWQKNAYSKRKGGG